MAIYIIQGKIGSGKTYYAVYHILKKYYEYHDDILDYAVKKDVILISNIDDLKLSHINLFAEINKYNIEYVFSETYVNSLRSSSRASVIYLIDEAQSEKLFHRKFYNVSVFNFFQMCRHHGVDIYLITQDVQSLAKELRNLAEYVVEAVPRHKKVANFFTYKYITNDEVFKTVRIPKLKQVFRQYKSFSYLESEKIKSVYTKYIVMTLAFFIFSFLMLKYLVFNFFTDKNAVSSNKNSSSQMQTVHSLTKDNQLTENNLNDISKSSVFFVNYSSLIDDNRDNKKFLYSHKIDCSSTVTIDDMTYCVKSFKAVTAESTQAVTEGGMGGTPIATPLPYKHYQTTAY